MGNRVKEKIYRSIEFEEEKKCRFKDLYVYVDFAQIFAVDCNVEKVEKKL